MPNVAKRHDVGLLDDLSIEEASALVLYFRHTFGIEDLSITDQRGKKQVNGTVLSYSHAERLSLLGKGFIDGRFRAPFYE